MKITCDKTLLVEAVSNVSRAVSPKSNLPTLEGILMKAGEDRLTLTGYDLELGISTSIEAKVLEAGEIVLSAKLLADMIKRMPGEVITIESDEKLLTLVKSGVTEYTILGMSPVDFPELPSLTDVESISISQGILKSMISQTLFAIATTDSKPVHTGSMFDVTEEGITLVSVDGYRLALRREKLRTNQNIRFIVPGKTLSEISKLLSEDDVPTELQVSRKHIIFQIDGYSVVSRLLEGEFLDYTAAIPQNSSTAVEIATRTFIDSIERTSLLISDRLRSPLRIRFGSELIKMSCSTALGKAYDEISGKMTGPEVEMGFNNKYILDALRAADCDEVRLEIGGPLSPMKVVPIEGDSFLFLVLPVRLKSE